MLNDLQSLVNELKNTSSSNKKKEILAKYPQCKSLLNYTFNPKYNYYISSDNILKQEKILSSTSFSGPNLFGGSLKTSGRIYITLDTLLEDLNAGKISGLTAIKAVLTFLKRKENLPYRDLILNILDRDLKCRTSESIINKVWPGLIPIMKVALANNYWDVADSIDFTKEEYFASHKLDGIRLIVIIDENKEIKCFSRNGKEIFTLDRVKEEIKDLFPQLQNYVFDGEICIVDEDGVEHFNEAMRQVTRKDHTIISPRYKIFDLLHRDEFEPGESQVDLKTRLKRWDHITKNGAIKSDILALLPQTLIRDKKHFEALFAEAQGKGWEGLILRKNTTYKGKRSNDLLKVKSFFDGEYKVIRSENGPFQVVREGKEATETMMTRVFIEHKGYEVGVGSGFTLEERRDFYKHPEHIVGKTITVKYFEETTNQSGTVSLRFPTIKVIHGREREV